MACAVRTRNAVHAPEVRVQKDDSNALHEFARSASVLRNLFFEDRPLDEATFIFMDKSFQVLQMAHLRWKRVHKATDESQQSSTL
jgi:hypothetical protein